VKPIVSWPAVVDEGDTLVMVAAVSWWWLGRRWPRPRTRRDEAGRRDRRDLHVVARALGEAPSAGRRGVARLGDAARRHRRVGARQGGVARRCDAARRDEGRGHGRRSSSTPRLSGCPARPPGSCRRAGRPRPTSPSPRSRSPGSRSPSRRSSRRRALGVGEAGERRADVNDALVTAPGCHRRVGAGRDGVGLATGALDRRGRDGDRACDRSVGDDRVLGVAKLVVAAAALARDARDRPR